MNIKLGAKWSKKKGAYHYGYSLMMSNEPSFGYGGEAFGVQPQVLVLYEDVVNTTFDGYVYAELEHSPTDLEMLWFGNDSAGPTNGQAQVEGGIATFNVRMSFLLFLPLPSIEDCIIFTL